MMVIGLTGMIASGKSTIAQAMRYYHLPVFDSDKSVHQLLGPKGRAVPAILAEFGACGSWQDGIDRPALGAIVFANSDALQRLEEIVHPHVARLRHSFIQQARISRRRAVILDVPLLFETGIDKMCDITITAWAPDALLRQRALRRPAMTDEKLQGILAKQMPQLEKIQHSDEKIATGLGRGVMMRQIKRCLVKWQLR